MDNLNEEGFQRPEDMSEHLDQIAQHVAEFMVSSCNSAAYYQKLREKTQHNAYFNFLDPAHPHYAYYEFLVKSYTEWKKMLAEQQALTSGIMQETNYAYDAYGYDIGNEYSHGTEYVAEAVYPPHQNGIDAINAQQNRMRPAAHPLPPNSGSPQQQQQHQQMLLMQQNEDDDEEDEYTLVEDNGIKKLVQRQR